MDALWVLTSITGVVAAPSELWAESLKWSFLAGMALFPLFLFVVVYQFTDYGSPAPASGSAAVARPATSRRRPPQRRVVLAASTLLGTWVVGSIAGLLLGSAPTLWTESLAWALVTTMLWVPLPLMIPTPADADSAPDRSLDDLPLFTDVTNEPRTAPSREIGAPNDEWPPVENPWDRVVASSPQSFAALSSEPSSARLNTPARLN
jgi:hypothetical protein